MRRVFRIKAVKMSRPLQPLQGQLQSLTLDNVEETGKTIGRGAYSVVSEVRVSGLVCGGKPYMKLFYRYKTVNKSRNVHSISVHLFLRLK